MAPKISNSLAGAQGTAVATAIGSNAILEVRSGAAPATADTAASGTLLCTVTVPGSWTSATNSGVTTVTSGDPVAVDPVASGTAGHARLKTSGGSTMLDCTVTATGGGGDIQLGSTTITTGVKLDIGPVVLTVPKG